MAMFAGSPPAASCWQKTGPARDTFPGTPPTVSWWSMSTFVRAEAPGLNCGPERWIRSSAVISEIRVVDQTHAFDTQHFLFFSPSPQSQKAADAFLQRLEERWADRDTAVSDQTVQAQLTAIVKWGQAPSST